MPEDTYLPDGTVRIEENITYYRYMPRKIYEIMQALYMMKEDEHIKVMRYIQRITGKRLTFDTLIYNRRKRSQIKALKKIDAQND